MVKADRLRKLLRLIASQDLEGLLITHLPNIRYLSGFTGGSATCLVAERECLFFTDFRYRLQANREVRGFRVIPYTGQGAIPEIAGHIERLGLARVGFEEEILSYGRYQRLRRALDSSCRLIPTPPLVERLRRVKDEGELREIRGLAGMADAVIAECRKRIAVGVTEREIARCLEQCAHDLGADGLAFTPIVASGRNSAMPHHRSGAGTVRKDAPLLIDFGLSRNGYNSDLTRTFYLGRVARRYREIYTIVLEAQHAAREVIRAGVTAGEVDAAARRIISSCGYADYFGHGLGHGIGLEVHETPRLREGSRETLETGMTVTVEPGVYIPGWGGVRIEDMVLVTESGCTVLTSAARRLEENLL